MCYRERGGRGLAKFQARQADNLRDRIVLKLERKWIATVPWACVVAVNKELCEKDGQPHATSSPGYEQARGLWTEAEDRVLGLAKALDLFRQVHKLAPFKFFNGNTVAAVAKKMMGDVLETMPSVEAQMARSTVSHYVVGAIRAKELEEVLAHVGQHLEKTLPSSK